MAYQSQYTGAQHDAYVTKQSLVDLIYPVGAIYMSVNSTSPATLFGGTWVEIAGKFLVGADNTFTAGETGGSDKHTHIMAHTHTYAHTHTTPATTTGSHTLTLAEAPAHTHGRGTMNITGNTKYISADAIWNGTADGAFRSYSSSGAPTITNVAKNGTATGYYFKFNAADGWTGSTDSQGGGWPYSFLGRHYHKFTKCKHNFRGEQRYDFRSIKSAALPQRIYVETYRIKLTSIQEVT